MPKYSHIQESFNAGEWGPLTYARVIGDISGLRAASLKLCENFIPTLQGPLRKRNGSRYGKNTNTSTQVSRLLPYIPSTGTAGAVELYDTGARILLNDGTAATGSTIATPYTVASDNIFKVLYAQLNSQLYMTHPDYPQQYITSDLAGSNTLTVPEYNYGPIQTENTTSTTMTASAVSGSVTITASAASFTSNMTPGGLGAAAGQLIAFRCIPQALHAQWATGTAYSSGNYVWSESYETPGRINVYKATSTGTSGALAPGHDSGTESDGAVSWQMVHTEYGFVRVTGYTSTTQVTASVVGFPELPSDSTGGVTRWAWGSWSREFGFPRAVAFFQQRAFFGGTNKEPQTIWGSRAGDQTFFLPNITADDAAVNYTLDSDIAVPVQFLLPGRQLMIGTTGGEFFASGANGESITPTNIQISRDTRHGCAPENAIAVGPSYVFIQQGRKTLREARFNDLEQSYNANNVSLLASHFTDEYTGSSRLITGLSYQANPDSVVWMSGTEADGNYGAKRLLGVSFDRQFQVQGWHQHSVAGAESIFSPIVIPNADGTDRLMFIVKRTINAATQYSIEWIDDGESPLHHGLDSAITGTATASQTVITGLGHLEGETVTAVRCASGETDTVGRTTSWRVYPQLTVASGQITLPTSMDLNDVYVVGLPFVAKALTQEPEGGAGNGTAQGKKKRISSLVFRLYNTAIGLAASAAQGSALSQLFFREADQNMNAGVPLYSGDTKPDVLLSDYSEGAEVYFEHSLPGPCMVLAIMPQIEVSDDR